MLSNWMTLVSGHVHCDEDRSTIRQDQFVIFWIFEFLNFEFFNVFFLNFLIL